MIQGEKDGTDGQDAPDVGTSPSSGNGRSSPPSPSYSSTSLKSDLLARRDFAYAHGLQFQFNGSRDLYSALGYPDKLTIADYRARYERGDIAETIVEYYPKAVWSNEIAIVENEDPETITTFEEQWSSLVSRLDVWNTFRRLHIQARLSTYSVLLIGGPGDNLASELPKMRSPDQVLYLTPYSEDRAGFERKDLDTKKSSLRFGLPTRYWIKLIQGEETKTEVHWTRVIHCSEGGLDSPLYGKPALRSVWNRLVDLDKQVGGGSEAAWNNMNPGAFFDLDPEMVLTPEEETKFNDEIEDFYHGMRRFARTRGVKPTKLAGNVYGFGSNVDTILSLISATTRIPKRILEGSERGELSSTQDRNNRNDEVDTVWSFFAAPLIRTFVDRLIQYGALVKPKEYQAVPPREEEMTEVEKADVSVKMADAKVLSVDEIRDRVYGLEPMEVEEEEEVEESEPEDEEEEVGEVEEVEDADA